ncbi:MAG: ATP-binding domain-containing protein [Ruminiclostridium sp.]|nr:ATP-binding domain-containing protein [Ruminiclostridium sp.]
MVIKILKSLKCGYLLLGDMCQAIYDYDCNDYSSINSSKFYELLDQTVPNDTKRFELIGNKRQTEKLDRETSNLRNCLLHRSDFDVETVFSNNLNSIPICEYDADNYKLVGTANATTAFLCRNNGEAEYLSWLFFKNSINHTLIRTNSGSVKITRFIADILWDYRDKNISINDFIKRATIRCGLDENKALEMFDNLKELLYDDSERYYLDVPLLAQKMCFATNLPSALVYIPSNTIVSTIHKAKGREFDRVYLLGYDYTHKQNDTEEERILYVGETRPKLELNILKKGNKYNWFFRKSQSNRWIQTKCKKNNPYSSYCSAIATGYDEDVDYSSFVSGEFPDALKRQMYISRYIKPGDIISLSLKNGIYDIVHNNHVIGQMSKYFSDALTDRYGNSDNKRSYINPNGLPNFITDLYVANIITYISYRDYDNIPAEYRHNRYWLALEISGFGKTRWEND